MLGQAAAALPRDHGTGKDGLLLCLDDGQAIRRPTFGAMWREVRESAGLPKARFHDTRHTFASQWVMAGGSLRRAKEAAA